MSSNLRCSLERPSDPWKQAARHACRYLGELQPRRPAGMISQPNHVTFAPAFMAMPKTYHGELVEWTSGLDVCQSLLQILQLSVDLALGLLGTLHGLRLECLNGLDLSLDIVLLWLESVELLLDVVDHVLVLEDAAVLGEVDGLGLLGKDLDAAARIVVALLEVGERGGGVASETEFGAKVGPVDFEGCRTLRRKCWVSRARENAVLLRGDSESSRDIALSGDQSLMYLEPQGFVL